MSDVVGIGGVIIFHLSKLRKATFFILCDVILLARLLTALATFPERILKAGVLLSKYLSVHVCINLKVISPVREMGEKSEVTQANHRGVAQVRFVDVKPWTPPTGNITF